MPASDLSVPIEAIRREAERARDASSLRAVARDADVSPMGLRNFLQNAGKPQARTLRKLNKWYARRMATGRPEGEDEARAALVILAGFFPESERHRVLGDWLGRLEADFIQSDVPVPTWLEKLRTELVERDA